MYRLLLTSATLAISLGLGGCSEEANSEDIRTSGIYAAINVDSTSPNSGTVNVALTVGGSGSNTYINLTGGDTLTASLNGGAPQLLGSVRDGIDRDRVTYKTTFNSTSAGAAGASYKVSFNRDIDTDAPNSTVTIPATLANFTNNATTAVSRATGTVILTWDAGSVGSGSSLGLSIEGDCIDRFSRNISDNGQFIIGANLLYGSNSCSVTATLEATKSGLLDSNYGEGGYIRAHKYASTSFTSAP